MAAPKYSGLCLCEVKSLPVAGFSAVEQTNRVNFSTGRALSSAKNSSFVSIHETMAKIQKIALLLAFLVLGYLFHARHIREFPANTHAWAQSDRLAIAHGFVDNGLNFFKPQTYIYNHKIQSTKGWLKPDATNITAVDFPIHDYIPAVAMKMSGTRAPWLFRTYILLYSFAGLFFLFQLSKLLQNKDFVSWFIVLFAATSPVYVYYQSGFLPTVPSIANAIIGLYLYAKFLEKKQWKSFYWSLFFLTLGALSRTTLVIPLVAVLGVEFIQMLKNRQWVWKQWIAAGISVLALGLYFAYNAYLRKTYGTLFLIQLMPASDFAEFKALLKIVYHNWFFQYFTKTHYLAWFLLVLAGGIAWWKNRQSETTLRKRFLGLIVLYSIGTGLFFLVMARQFEAHDYYFLDTFYLPFVLLMAFCCGRISWGNTFIRYGSYAVMLLLMLVWVRHARQAQVERRLTGSWDKTNNTISDYTGSDAFLSSLGIARNAKILVLDAVAPNIPFLLMNRPGYVNLSTDEKTLRNMLTFPYDYVVLQDAYFLPEIYSNYPAITTELQPIASNGRITVYRKQKGTRSLDAFLGLQDKKPVLEAGCDYESAADSQLWENTEALPDAQESANHVGSVTPAQEFGLTFALRNSGLLQQNTLVKVTGRLRGERDKQIELVVSLNDKGQNTYYRTYALNNFFKDAKHWGELNLIFHVPAAITKENDLKVYFLNVGKGTHTCDDIQVRMYASAR